MVRVPYVNRDDLDAKGQEIYDRIRQDRNSAEVGLQFRALLNNPEAAGYLTSMGAQLRFQSSVPDNLKELAIILVAREWNSGIEWTGHAVAAAPSRGQRCLDREYPHAQDLRSPDRPRGYRGKVRS